jgi:hypothetical protein
VNVLMATSQTQGWRDKDSSWTVEGELVFTPRIECDRGSVDDDCGCRRAMAGTMSHRATTTIKVTQRKDLDPDTYFTLIRDALMDQGYVTKDLLTDPGVNEWLRDITLELTCMARSFEVGTILERRGDFIFERRTSASGPAEI